MLGEPLPRFAASLSRSLTMRFLSLSCLRFASCKPQHHGLASLTLLFSPQRSFDSTDHFCSPPFVWPARIDGLTRPLTCSQAFGTDVGNQRSRANGSVIGSSMSWATCTVKLRSRQPPERPHDESMIMPYNTLRQLQPPSFLKKTIGPSVSGRSNLFTTTVVKKPLNCFFAQLFL